MSDVRKQNRNIASDTNEEDFLKKLKLLTDMPINNSGIEERSDPTPNKNLIERIINHYRQTLNLPEERLKINFLPTQEEINSEYKKRFPEAYEDLEKKGLMAGGWTLAESQGPSSGIEIVVPSGSEKTLWHEFQHARDAVTDITNHKNHFSGGKKNKSKDLLDQIRKQELEILNDELNEKKILDEATQKRVTGVIGDEAKKLMYPENNYYESNNDDSNSSLLEKLINSYRYSRFRKWLYDHNIPRP